MIFILLATALASPPTVVANPACITNCTAFIQVPSEGRDTKPAHEAGTPNAQSLSSDRDEKWLWVGFILGALSLFISLEGPSSDDPYGYYGPSEY